MINADFNDLTTKGYVVTKSFLDQDEVDLLKENYTHGRVPTPERHYTPSAKISINCQLVIYKKILKAITQIKEQKILDIDFIMPGAEFISTKNVSYKWHQDYETYYVLQQNYNSLNFYIPIIKPNPALSGLSIIPFDVLENLMPDQVDLIRNQGATRYIPDNQHQITNVINEDVGLDPPYLTLSHSIDYFATSPILNPGDLLLLRGDMIHQTQDNLTTRTSVSFRAHCGKALINKTRLFSGCAQKKLIIEKNSSYYNWIKSRFDLLGKDDITAAELFKPLILHNGL